MYIYIYILLFIYLFICLVLQLVMVDPVAVILIILIIYLIKSYLFGEQKNNSILWRLYGNGTFQTLADKFSTLEEVTEAVRKSGLESCNLIIGERDGYEFTFLLNLFLYVILMN